MQYKVPQNVDIEDKVIAGLTLRQFMFLMIAGGGMVLCFFFFQGATSFLFLPSAVLIAGIGISFAFVKINDRPFEIFIISAAKTLLTPSVRVWQKDTDTEIPPHTETKQTREGVRPKKNVAEMRSSLEKLATVVDSGGVADTDHIGSRQSNIKPTEITEPSRVTDVLENAESDNPILRKFIEQASAFVAKKHTEPTVGAISTVKTKKGDFKYDELELASEKKLEDSLDKIESKQKELDEELDNAKIEKFPRS